MILTTLLTAAALTHADAQFTNKTRKGNSASYGKYEITYPVLNASAAPAYREINAALLKKARAAHCDAGSGRDVEHNERLEVKAITPDFVSLEDQTDGFCGGAHPWANRDGLVYDARTGREVDLRVEMGEPSLNSQWSDADYERYRSAHARKVKFLVTRLSTEDAQCFKDEESGPPTTQELEEALDGVSYAFGVEKGAVKIYGEPPHVIHNCAFDVTVPYAEIRDLIDARSPLHQWLSK